MHDWPQVPYVGVGCVVMHAGKVLLVRDHRGLWSTPGGHLDFGESPEAAAERETREEAGISVSGLEFLAITNDVLEMAGKHYVTIWMRAFAADPQISIRDTAEIAEAGWFDPMELPEPRQVYFQNLLSGHTLPKLTRAFLFSDEGDALCTRAVSDL